MKQSRYASLIESVVNILVGFGLSCALQATVLPALGVPMPWSVNLVFALVMTLVSIVRSYTLRRVFEALHIRRPLSPFAQAVVAERYRQIDVECWSLEHDDKHEPGELALAGAAYAMHAANFHDAAVHGSVYRVKASPPVWPWSREWWKPQDFRRDLVRATALMIAEGERHDRNRKRSPRPDWDNPRPASLKPAKVQR